jgi:PPOX class probable F420-dependent enzyme
MITPSAKTPVSPAVLSEAARAFLDAPRFGVVATLNPDGSPIQAVIWYRLEGDAIVFNSRVGRVWPTNLVRDPRVSLTVADGYEYVDLRGEVEIDDDPERGWDVISELARRYETVDGHAAEQIARFRAERRVTFTLRPTHVFERLG